jgi:pimeloyl-ACP methyl ester carboxylesterase
LGQEKLESWRKNGDNSDLSLWGRQRNAVGVPILWRMRRSFEAFPDIRQPGLLFHGVDDPLVPIAQSRTYAASHPNIRLLEFRSGHELTDVLDDMWLAAREFLLGDVQIL